ncbi:hypothetical protein G6F22_021990 [Rhizopus arrhizus]|nr:hypothetical protein G6F22_021990 [Rhizopus arrhizus]
MERTTPPSTRSAAPLVAEACAAQQRRRAVLGDEVAFHVVLRHALFLGHFREEVGHPFRARRAGQHRVDRDAGAGGQFGQPARHA